MSAADIVIGCLYLTIGLFGIIENSLTSILMATDHHMRNPTYIYMINLGITDALILLPIAAYAGVAIIFPYQATAMPIVRISAYLVAIGWYPGCLFMVLAAFSRYVQLAMPYKIPVYFSSTRLILSIIFVWSIPAIIYTHFLYYTPLPFTIFLNHYTWAFDRDDPFGDAWAIVNITLNSCFAILIVIFNMKSLLCIRKIRKQVQSFETNKNQKREIKLFLQCAITGTIYIAAVVYYFVVSAVEKNLPWYAFVITHLLWAANHIQNPIIYLVLNKRLRKRLVDLVMQGKWAPMAAVTDHVPTTHGKSINQQKVIVIVKT